MVEGLSPPDEWKIPPEYGNYFHICEEELKSGRWMNPCWTSPTAVSAFFAPLTEYVEKLIVRYPLSQSEILHWYNVAKIQFPIYERYWADRAEEARIAAAAAGTEPLKRTTLFVEEKFDVKYPLPSGRSVRLRGKLDLVEVVGEGRGAGVLLTDHKTKGEIDEEEIAAHLLFDLQLMWYIVALKTLQSQGKLPVRGKTDPNSLPILGACLNIVRRPLSGGKGSIRQKQSETLGDFYARLRGVIEEDQDSFFVRMNVEVSQRDVEAFERQFMRPVLEQLCDWWAWVSACYRHGVSPFEPSHSGIRGIIGSKDGGRFIGHDLHWRTPWFWDPLREGGSDEIGEYVAGRRAALEKCKNLFPELQD